MPSNQVGVLLDERPSRWATRPISRLGIGAMMNREVHGEEFGGGVARCKVD